MAERNNIQQFMQLATDINRNLSQIIHLSNNLRYNTYHLLNHNTSILANDIFFPPDNLLPLPRTRTPTSQLRPFFTNNNTTA